jgi:hypothetical protein
MPINTFRGLVADVAVRSGPVRYRSGCHIEETREWARSKGGYPDAVILDAKDGVEEHFRTQILHAVVSD